MLLIIHAHPKQSGSVLNLLTEQAPVTTIGSLFPLVNPAISLFLYPPVVAERVGIHLLKFRIGCVAHVYVFPCPEKAINPLP